MQTPLQTISAQFALSYVKTLSTRQNLAAIVSQAPQLLTQPMSFTVHNLRPFDIAVAAAVDFVGLIDLLILSFIISGQHFGARLATGIQHRLRLRSILILRVAAPLATYLWVSLMYSLLSLAYLVPFGRTFGKAGFVIYWMMSFCAMSALGLALEVMVTLLTMRFVPFFLILWIICESSLSLLALLWADAGAANVSVSYYPIEALPGIFRYGYGSPFYNVSRTVRTILFNTKNDRASPLPLLLPVLMLTCVDCSGPELWRAARVGGRLAGHAAARADARKAARRRAVAEGAGGEAGCVGYRLIAYTYFADFRICSLYLGYIYTLIQDSGAYAGRRARRNDGVQSADDCSAYLQD